MATAMPAGMRLQPRIRQSEHATQTNGRAAPQQTNGRAGRRTALGALGLAWVARRRDVLAADARGGKRTDGMMYRDTAGSEGSERFLRDNLTAKDMGCDPKASTREQVACMRKWRKLQNDKLQADIDRMGLRKK